MYTKHCPKCQSIKPLDEFHSSKNRKDGHHWCCKICNNKARKNRFNKLPDSVYLHRLAELRSKLLNREFTITVADVEAVDTDFCPLLKIPIKRYPQTNKNNCRHDDSKSLDRIDPTKGYIPGNIRVISWRANNLLGVGRTEQDLLNITNGHQI